jgi:hypothetical protein
MLVRDVNNPVGAVNRTCGRLLVAAFRGAAGDEVAAGFGVGVAVGVGVTVGVDVTVGVGDGVATGAGSASVIESHTRR